MIEAKKFSVNVGTDIVPKGLFKVTYNSRRGSYITKVPGKVSGNAPLVVDNKFSGARASPQKMNNGLNSAGM